jgi:predicted esterase
MHREFYVPKDFAKADWALDEANKRLDSLDKGESPWTMATGLVVRGYRSNIDYSAQPYGLVIPKDHDFSKPIPLYVWLHGRGDKNTDLHFLQERATKTGQIAPPNAIVLHPFGRHCVGWKHAGEIDVLDATAQVQKRYRITPNRTAVLIGFSMGGAGAWHIGAHYADRWIAVSPGAGFAETARYQRLTPDKYPPEYEQKLWGLYDVPGYVRNLFNTRVIAYSGELDKQIQAARVMEEAYKSEGRELEHLIGPDVEHKYEPKTLEELLHRLDTVVALTDWKDVRAPRKVQLQTRTLRYGRMHWVRATGLGEHWKDARIDATWDSTRGMELKTSNVSRIDFEERFNSIAVKANVDGFDLGHGRAPLIKEGETWRWAREDERPGQQGPIDDALMEPFVVVVPSGKSRNPAFQAWCDFELEHFRNRWRALMRAELPVVQDTDFTANRRHIILWGDPDSNEVIRRMISSLPVEFDAGNWKFGGQAYEGNRFAPALIFPRARNGAAGYIVLNSGLTFREGHDKTNSQQNPKLPDWAIIDITQPPDAFSPGRIHDAGFFDEEWKLKGPVKGP